MKPFPLEGRVRPEPVIQFTGLSYSTLMRRWKSGLFPAPVKIGSRINLFDAAAVRRWAADPENWKGTEA